MIRAHSMYWKHSVVFTHEVETMEPLSKKTANDDKSKHREKETSKFVWLNSLKRLARTIE